MRNYSLSFSSAEQDNHHSIFFHYFDYSMVFLEAEPCSFHLIVIGLFDLPHVPPLCHSRYKNFLPFTIIKVILIFYQPKLYYILHMALSKLQAGE